MRVKNPGAGLHSVIIKKTPLSKAKLYNGVFLDAASPEII
jgi:hypothetical protein